MICLQSKIEYDYKSCGKSLLFFKFHPTWWIYLGELRLEIQIFYQKSHNGVVVCLLKFDTNINPFDSQLYLALVY